MSAIENACNGGILYGTTNRRRCINDFLVHAHRTLQAYFFDFIIDYIKTNAIHFKEEPLRWFDDRNGHVGIICKQICDSTDVCRVFDFEKKELTDAKAYFPTTSPDVCTELAESETLK